MIENLRLLFVDYLPNFIIDSDSPHYLRAHSARSASQQMRIVFPRALKASRSLCSLQPRLSFTTFSSRTRRGQPAPLQKISAVNSQQAYFSSYASAAEQAQPLATTHADGDAEQPVRDHIPRQMEDNADVDESHEDNGGEVYINPRETGEDPSEISKEDYGGYAVGDEEGGDLGEAEKFVEDGGGGDHVPEMMEDDAEEDEYDSEEDYVNSKELGEDSWEKEGGD
ncbi:MAG: hypothetical protein M1812_004483 [Candelaria pacifica]|nr:MAG: hypothetical protein M1812_004483 [Candelaria pacifica]